jgi:hypothetical protein
MSGKCLQTPCNVTSLRMASTLVGNECRPCSGFWSGSCRTVLFRVDWLWNHITTKSFAGGRRGGTTTARTADSGGCANRYLGGHGAAMPGDARMSSGPYPGGVPVGAPAIAEGLLLCRGVLCGNAGAGRALDYTANYQTSYLGYGFIAFVNVQTLIEFMHNKYCCNKDRCAFDQCRAKMDGLGPADRDGLCQIQCRGIRTAPRCHADPVQVQRYKDGHHGNVRCQGTSRGIVFFDGGAVVSIEYGKVELTDQDDLMNAKAMSRLIDSSLV